MKNIHVLPTDKPSRLVLNSINNDLFLTTTKKFPSDIMKFKNIYITSDEDFKEGWHFNTFLNKYIYVNYKDVESLEIIYGTNLKHLQKIILTDNKDLIKDGVQAIDDEFLEWFVKNPSCERVEFTEYLDSGFSYGYKIIIPKEETKQKMDINTCRHFNIEVGCEREECICENQEPKKETLEEFAKRRFNEERLNTYTHYNIEDAIKEGAKWQQEQNKNLYSEEEIMGMFDNFKMHLPLHYEMLVREQFKKK